MDTMTPEELADLADMQLNRLEVYQVPVSQYDAVNKNYTDSKFSDAITQATQSVTDVIGGAQENMNTLSEIASALLNNPSLGATLVASISAVQASVTTEVGVRSADVALINSSLVSENSARTLEVARLDNLILTETNERMALDGWINGGIVENREGLASELVARDLADVRLEGLIAEESKARSEDFKDFIDEKLLRTDLQSSTDIALSSGIAYANAEKVVRDAYRESDTNEYKALINDESEARVAAVGILAQNKMDNSPNFSSGGSEGNPKVTEGSYMYIGDSWRIYANNAGSKKKLEFQYASDGVNFKVAVPFIRG